MPTRILIEPQNDAQLDIILTTAIYSLRSVGVPVVAGALIDDDGRRHGVLLLKDPAEKPRALQILSKTGIKARAAIQA